MNKKGKEEGVYQVVVGREELTISSLIPFAFPQALITQASLNAITATRSTPLSFFNVDNFSMKPGRWRSEQPGVKAPGTETRTTFLPANSVVGKKRRGLDL